MKTEDKKKISIKTNYILNLLRVFSTAFITIFTMPYLNRVLGVENVGKVEYVFTIINYFVLFSAVGIPMYGIREVSKLRQNKKALFTLVSELLLILSITTVLSYAFIFGILLNLQALSNYRNLLLIMSAMVLFSNIGAEWYFQGIENQKFITIRNVVVRFSIFGLIFILVKDDKDYVTYSILFTIMLFGANFINLIVILREIISNKIVFSDLRLKKHLKPIFSIFVATVSVNIYLQLDNFLIGSISGDKYVAYYALANKLIRYLISFIIIIGSVALPRLSYLYHSNKLQYNQLLKKVFDFMMIIAIPSSIYFFIFSSDIILFMGGEDFLAADLTMKILSPLCIIVSFAYFFGFLVLYAQEKEKIYTFATIFSAVVSLILNFYSIKRYQHNGAAVVALIAEFIAIIVMFFYINKEKRSVKIFNINFIKIIVANVILFILIQILKNNVVVENKLIGWLTFSALFVTSYTLGLLALKEENSIHYLKQIFSKRTITNK